MKSEEVYTQAVERLRDRTDNRLAKIVFNADLRSGHVGLAAQAKNLKINLDQMSVGEFVVFINRARSAAKFMSPDKILISHWRMPNGGRMNPKVIKLIPRYFNGREFHYDQALAKVVRDEFHVDDF